MEALNPTKITILFVSTLIIFSLANAKSQSSNLGKLYKAKYHSKSGIDKGLLFDPELDDDYRIINHHHNHDYERNKVFRENDKIERLPGQPPEPVKFNQYGGYVTVDEKAGRAFYYYFVEADSPKKDSLPLLLWLNGGPGCSSLAYGAMQELGPFRVSSDGKTLFRTKFAWNRVANVLFLESPAGVGFSYSNTSSDYDKNGDRLTAHDNYVFLIRWLERFPEYKGRDFFISGESYAGHYVPQLAHVILHRNAKPKATFINLKAIIIGNAVINDETDTRGMYEYFWTHALVSEEDNNKLMKHCDFSPNANTTQDDECNSAMQAIDVDIQNIDIYNIYAPVCISSNLTLTPKKPSQVIDPCSDNYVHAYMNSPEVQKALHANVTKVNYDWEACSDIISKWGDSPTTIIPLLKEFMAKGIRVWVFSGDIDGRVPVTSTKESINAMKVPIKTKWYPWFINGQVGGYTQAYEGNLTFATVRGAGHQVPSFQPLRALALINHFLSGSSLPNTSTTNLKF